MPQEMLSSRFFAEPALAVVSERVTGMSWFCVLHEPTAVLPLRSGHSPRQRNLIVAMGSSEATMKQALEELKHSASSLSAVASSLSGYLSTMNHFVERQNAAIAKLDQAVERTHSATTRTSGAFWCDQQRRHSRADESDDQHQAAEVLAQHFQSPSNEMKTLKQAHVFVHDRPAPIVFRQQCLVDVCRVLRPTDKASREAMLDVWGVAAPGGEDHLRMIRSRPMTEKEADLVRLLRAIVSQLGYFIRKIPYSVPKQVKKHGDEVTSRKNERFNHRRDVSPITLRTGEVKRFLTGDSHITINDCLWSMGLWQVGDPDLLEWPPRDDFAALIRDLEKEQMQNPNADGAHNGENGNGDEDIVAMEDTS
jgi:hypothetical protein